MDPCLQYSECSLDRYMEKDFRKRRRCFLKSFLYVNLPENLAGLFFDGTDRTPSTECAETPMILSSPSLFRTSPASISSCPTCTPSASISNARSTLSLMINGTLYSLHSFCISFASSKNACSERFFSRSCKKDTPPSNACLTCSYNV